MQKETNYQFYIIAIVDLDRAMSLVILPSLLGLKTKL